MVIGITFSRARFIRQGTKLKTRITSHTARSSERIKCSRHFFAELLHAHCKVGRGNTVDSIARIGARMPRVQLILEAKKVSVGRAKIIKGPSHNWYSYYQFVCRYCRYLRTRAIDSLTKSLR